MGDAEALSIKTAGSNLISAPGTCLGGSVIAALRSWSPMISAIATVYRLL